MEIETNNKKSKYKGVFWNSNLQRWTASVSENGFTHECGYFIKEEDAVKKRDVKIIAIGQDEPLQFLRTLYKN